MQALRDPSGITSRQRQVVELIAQGLSNDEVGLVLGDALAAVWTAPVARRVQVMPPGQPSTGVWWGLVDDDTASAAERFRLGLAQICCIICAPA